MIIAVITGFLLCIFYPVFKEITRQLVKKLKEVGKI